MTEKPKILDDFPYDNLIKNDLKREAIKHIKNMNIKGDEKSVIIEEGIKSWIKYWFSISNEDLK
ncbi:hypothetical protein LCGC14_2812420 [marine sediment metagenome]|uniref:Uncharacterized protein n=1 Tax=marine sediment metagenome TaxID=412755 RepID=A0A0F8Z6B1_9ZZZZ